MLDFDEASLYHELMSEYANRCWPTVKTQRGYHVYFEYSESTKEAFDTLPCAIDKLDLKAGRPGAGGQQIWFPGCRVKQRDGSYFRYEWMLHDQLTHGVGLLCQMPSDLIDTLTAMAKSRHETPLEKAQVPPPLTIQAAPSAPLAVVASASAELNHDQKRAALITGQHVLENKIWFQIVCAMRHSQCTYEDAVALTNRYLQASGKCQTSRFEKLRAGWDGAMANSKAKMGTIIHHAKQCNPAALTALCSEEKAAKKKAKTTKHTISQEGSVIDACEDSDPIRKLLRNLVDDDDGGRRDRVPDLKLAQAFLQLKGDMFVYQQQVMHIYFDSRWRIDPACELLRNVFMKTMTDRLVEAIQQGYQRTTAAKCLYDCQMPYKVNGMITAIKTELAGKLHAVRFDVGPEQYYNIQFANCVFDLKSKETRHRTASDYVTQILDYDFMPRESISDEVHREVRRFFEKLQPDEEQRRFQLSFLAYCITGSTAHQVSKMNIGYTASNGKSTELKVHSACFDIYTTKLDKRTFNQSYEKAHKQLIGLLRNPIRLAYIEELDRDKLDADLWKDFIDGDKLPVEVLYGTVACAKHQAKLMTCSNKDPNIAADAGVLRRTKCQLYESRFLDGVQDNDETRVYRKELAFEDRFRDPEYKNAYFHLLLEHVDQLVMPGSASELFSQIASDNDDFRNTLELSYEVTKDSKDRVSVRELVRHFRKMARAEVISNLKRLGLKYVRDERIEYTELSGSKPIKERGAVHGLKQRCNADQESDEPPSSLVACEEKVTTTKKSIVPNRTALCQDIREMIM